MSEQPKDAAGDLCGYCRWFGDKSEKYYNMHDCQMRTIRVVNVFSKACSDYETKQRKKGAPGDG